MNIADCYNTFLHYCTIIQTVEKCIYNVDKKKWGHMLKKLFKNVLFYEIIIFKMLNIKPQLSIIH